MPIIKSEQQFYLHADNLTMIIEEADGYLFLKYIGRQVKQYHGSNAVILKDHAFSGNPNPHQREFSMDTQRLLIGQHGLGDFRQPSIRIQHTNNETTDFRYESYEITPGVITAQGLPSPYASPEEATTLTLTLRDQVAHLMLKLYYTVYENSATITTFTQLINSSAEDVVVHRLQSVMLDLPTDNYDVITFQGAYAREKTVRRHTIDQGIFIVGSNRGASGHGQTPAGIITHPTTTDDFGEALSIQLMYSGNFEFGCQQNQLNELRVSMGIAADNFMWQLKPQESFDTPVAVLNFSYQGLNKLSQTSHVFIRQHIMPANFANQERPILINNWEATYFDFNRDKLLAIADKASELGIELFVLDDGWFGQRHDDNSSLGDWYVNEAKIQGSLSELIAQIKSRGLKFGIWIEPEMISENSDLYRKHPDWVIQLPNREHTYSRNQLVLNYANPEVVEYMRYLFDGLLMDYDIDYVKWDMNRNMTNIGNGADYTQTMMQSHQYMLGLYDLMAYLTTKHPEVLFESCSGGGGRNDLGMMRYFPQVWASDNTDAVSRLDIQHGSSYLHPVISMGAHVSAVPNHQLNRVTDLKTRGDVAMMGNLGYELDLNDLSQAEQQQVKDQVTRYKTIRSMVQLGQQYRVMHTANETAVQFKYGDQVLLTYVKVLSSHEEMETIVRLKDLEEEALYRVEDSSEVYSGAELMYAGLTMDVAKGDFKSIQILMTKVREDH
ncbi:alpha-galactosidase [Fundicoccus culcitae]|uniref:Alpha-galactosidase n=1 Tax=Fundicoccus culcitae TaxID=2969821 RepID=A0ABY5P7Q0_9LACT|nr:alpha-galactosidase [Fundicoccus culcitae]UUX34764.1 alpha-galactosidase [Fundicoccus culcitae]